LQPEEIKIQCFIEFDNIMVAHYEKLNSHVSKRKKWLEEVYVKIENQSSLSFKDYHVAIKEYKDSTKNISRVENLNSKFKTQYDSQTKSLDVKPFDKRSLHITYNYMLNNEFSFMISQGVDFKVIEQKYREIKNLQAETRIKNYFPSIKFASYLNDKIEHYFK